MPHQPTSSPTGPPPTGGSGIQKPSHTPTAAPTADERQTRLAALNMRVAREIFGGQWVSHPWGLSGVFSGWDFPGGLTVSEPGLTADIAPRFAQNDEYIGVLLRWIKAQKWRLVINLADDDKRAVESHVKVSAHRLFREYQVEAGDVLVEQLCRIALQISDEEKKAARP